jgi:hypothetical protein
MGFLSTILFLCSPMEGVVLMHGQPVAEASITRKVRWTWSDESTTETVTTGQDGRFAFEGISESAFWASWFPHEPVVEQTMSVEWQGKKFPVYYFSKRNYREGGEFDRARIVFRCELSETPSHRKISEFIGYSGVCTLVDA